MEENTLQIYKKIGRYSFVIAVIGAICYLTFFPQGIYYSFFCGVMAVAAAAVARKNYPSVRVSGGIILGIIDVGMSLMAFYGLYVIYTSVQDPIAGPKVTAMISQMLEQYGVSLETFAAMMAR